MERGHELLNKSSVVRALREKWESSDGRIHCINCGCVDHIRWHHVVPLHFHEYRSGLRQMSSRDPYKDRAALFR